MDDINSFDFQVSSSFCDTISRNPPLAEKGTKEAFSRPEKPLWYMMSTPETFRLLTGRQEDYKVFVLCSHLIRNLKSEAYPSIVSVANSTAVVIIILLIERAYP
jgi:hypothetical protein